MVEKLHCPVYVHVMGIDMGLKWAKEKEQAGLHPSCRADSLAEAPYQGMLSAEDNCACAYPYVIQGIPQLPPVPLKSCSSYQAASLPWVC